MAGATEVLDPQGVLDQDAMTWKDYCPIPGADWTDPARVPSERTIRIALVAADFEDQPFVATLPKGSDLFGNPRIEPILRSDVARFYADFWNKPQAVNHGHTVHEYWMEVSHGRIGVSFEAYGPYRMPRKCFQYGLDHGQGKSLPSGYGEGGDLVEDLDSQWKADAGGREYDLVLRVYAGYDETCLWQEFGEMKFQTREDIPPEWGNPDPAMPRWAPTRYVPWTSWKAASYLWSHSAIVNGECSGSIRHEISHAAFHIGDNNNNPYVTPYRRAGAGPWDIMDRGSFNGPGGPHRRWLVPVTEGGAMPAGLMLRQMLQFKFVQPEQVLQLSRGGLEKSGLVVAKVSAREVAPLPGTYAGITVRLDGPAPQDRTPPEDPVRNPLSSGKPDYDFYSMEVVQRLGYDSFCPDSGVLLARNKDRGSSTEGPNQFYCFNWVIDAHPEDMHVLDFTRPDGEKVWRTLADYRQLNDALFHAGLDSGSSFEWEDTPNRLHFYVVDLTRDGNGIREYTLGVRSLDGPGPRGRDVRVKAARKGKLPTRKNQPCVFTVQNPVQPSQDAAGPGTDIYRLSVAVEGRGWTARIPNALAAIPEGASREIAVQVDHGPGAASRAKVTLTAASESDPGKVSRAAISVN